MSIYRRIEIPSPPYKVDLITDFEDHIIDVLYYRFYKTDKNKYDYYYRELSHRYNNPLDTRGILNHLKNLAIEINSDRDDLKHINTKSWRDN